MSTGFSGSCLFTLAKSFIIISSYRPANNINDSGNRPGAGRFGRFFFSFDLVDAGSEWPRILIENRVKTQRINDFLNPDMAKPFEFFSGGKSF